MPNPVLTESKFLEGPDTAPGWGQAGGRHTATAPPPGSSGPPPAQAPAPGWSGPASAEPTMTIGGTATATAVLFVLILCGGAYGWSQVVLTQAGVDRTTGEQLYNVSVPSWIWLLMLGAFALGLVTAFMPRIARITAPLYALGYGVALGAISHIYDIQWNGIVAQAVGATLSTFAVMLFLYVTRILKVTQRMRMVIIGATLGIMLMYLVSWIATLFGADLYFWANPSPLGIGISIAICAVAAFNLLLDFDFIERMSGRAPKQMEWYGAFGLTVTIVWLYLEILRLLALLRQN